MSLFGQKVMPIKCLYCDNRLGLAASVLKNTGKNRLTKWVMDGWNKLRSHVASGNTIDKFISRSDKFANVEGRW